MPYPYFQAFPYNQMYYSQLQNVQQPQQNNQIQNGGFVMVKSINEAMSYPVAPGNSVTFKNESQPYIYTKTLGFSQLDQPIFEVFKLVKEETSEEIAEKPSTNYVLQEEANQMRAEIALLRSEIDFLKEYIESDNKEDISNDGC